ncbi:MAG: hypothetical protein COA78_23815 [Blastopirellula sp.]|nr:MAG: hypothetical protein COA78_23815 [Blastopirellula sp.]
MPHRIFDKLPSVSDLLENPPLKKLTETVSHSSIVSGVRSYMDRYQRELQARTADYRMPPIGDLAETISRWISGVDAGRAATVINGTGVMCSSQISQTPLPVAVLEAMFGRCRDFQSMNVGGDLDQSIDSEASSLLCQLTNSEAAIVTGNRAGALYLALANLPSGSSVVIARGQLGETFDGIRVPDLIKQAGLQLAEIGTTNSTTLAEYSDAIDDQTSAIIYFDNSNFSGVSAESCPGIEELAQLAASKKVPLIVDIGFSHLVDVPFLKNLGLTDVKQVVQQGANLVVASGGNLLGGPDCGILLGKTSQVSGCQSNPMVNAVRASNLTLVALSSVLELYLTSKQLEDEIATLSLVSTSVENLKHRSERLATLIGASELVESAESVSATAYLFDQKYSLDSFAIEVSAVSGKLEELQAKLVSSPYPLLCQEQDSKIVIDLRYIFPRQDMVVAEIFAS